MGTEAYVQHQLNKQLGEQAVTMRRVVNYANDESTATRHLDYGLSRGIALNMLRFCCNQRDVHFLRALSLRVLGDAINAHDDGILQAVAGVMAQVVPLDTDSDALESAVAGAPLGQVKLTASFLANKERVSLQAVLDGRPRDSAVEPARARCVRRALAASAHQHPVLRRAPPAASRKSVCAQAQQRPLHNAEAQVPQLKKGNHEIHQPRPQTRAPRGECRGPL